ncbi:hypothetical protein H9L39_08911 [Fusarium oxysporum f. sp. albedinis]|nr:hypothetical protein H9L39_08911 [Fusarium oxysporum f. sp. albedinis]
MDNVGSKDQFLVSGQVQHHVQSRCNFRTILHPFLDGSATEGEKKLLVMVDNSDTLMVVIALNDFPTEIGKSLAFLQCNVRLANMVPKLIAPLERD